MCILVSANKLQARLLYMNVTYHYVIGKTGGLHSINRRLIRHMVDGRGQTNVKPVLFELEADR